MCKVKILIWVWVLILVLLGSFVKMKIISAIRVSIPKSEGKSQLLRILYHQFQACQRFFVPFLFCCLLLESQHFLSKGLPNPLNNKITKTQ